MSGFFNKVFKGKDGSASKKNLLPTEPEVKPEDLDPWLRTKVQPEEVADLLRQCTKELKLRGLSTPFVLLSFRPMPDPGSPENFIRRYFKQGLSGLELEQELRLTEPMVLCSILKWCWSRLPGGVVTWEVYELFRVGEQESVMARDAFARFIPISVDNPARSQIIVDFFDLISAIAAHAKTNGLAGIKLSRLAGWWAFEHVDSGWGFDGGYASWTRAADATMHLFFAYMRSLTPIDGSVPMLPTSLRALLASVDYPPMKQGQLQSPSVKIVMTVETVSPTPFSLLRRAKNFEFRGDDKALQSFVQYEDPIMSLTDECRRVLKCISATNESSVLSVDFASGLRTQPSWSNFQSLGFSSVIDDEPSNQSQTNFGSTSPVSESFGDSFRQRQNMGPSHRTGDILARPTTPSWADFMVGGFNDKAQGGSGPSPLLLPPDKQLPPIDTSGRVRSSQSNMNGGDDLDPGELASVTPMAIDDAFWWVWMSSLAGEESGARKAVFGRCALAETKVQEGRWLVLEEKVKGAAQTTDNAAYIANKKGTKRGRIVKLGRRKSVEKDSAPKVIPGVGPVPPPPKPNIHPDMAARVQSVAAQLRHEASRSNTPNGPRNNEVDRKASMFTLQPVLVSEATSAMQWASKYDRDAIRDAYLNGSTAPPLKSPAKEERRLPDLPLEQNAPVSPVEQKVEKPLPSPAAVPVPSSPARESPSQNEYTSLINQVVDVRPASPEKKETPTPTATSPKSAQNVPTSPTPQPYNPQVKTKGSRLGKLFGRKSDKTVPTSGRITPVPEPPIKSISARDVSAPVHWNANNGNAMKDTIKSTDTNGDAPYAPVVLNKSQTVVSERPSKDNIRHYTNESNNTNTSSKEEQKAHAAFSTFDGGPLTDMPAFVPDDTPEGSVKAESVRGERISVDEDRYPTQTPMTPPNNNVNASEASLPAAISPMDRWAQIRKNAAERAQKGGAGFEPTPSPPVHRFSHEDGDTSGEETIESRVARIKARVAELTGNIDQAPNRY